MHITIQKRVKIGILQELLNKKDAWLSTYRNADHLRTTLARKLGDVQQDDFTDSPHFQLIPSFPGTILLHQATEAFRDRAGYVDGTRSRIEQARLVATYYSLDEFSIGIIWHEKAQDDSDMFYTTYFTVYSIPNGTPTSYFIVCGTYPLSVEGKVQEACWSIEGEVSFGFSAPMSVSALEPKNGGHSRTASPNFQFGWMWLCSRSDSIMYDIKPRKVYGVQETCSDIVQTKACWLLTR